MPVSIVLEATAILLIHGDLLMKEWWGRGGGGWEGEGGGEGEGATTLFLTVDHKLN